MAQVKQKFVGDSHDARREIDRLQAKYEQLEEKIKNTARHSRRASRTSRQGLRGQIGTLAKLAGSYASIDTAARVASAGVRSLVEENQRLSGAIDEVLGKLPESELKLRIQAGLTREQFEQQLPDLRREILETPAVPDFQTGLAIQQQLVSSGFREKDLESGKALEAVLQLRAATNQFDQSAEKSVQSVQAISSFLKSQGVVDPTAEEVRKTGGRVTQLFEGSEIQFPDLAALAKEASPLVQKGITRQQQLAAFSVLRDELPAPEAARGLRLTASRLAGAGAQSKKVEALESIGLKPEDVDLIGESLPEALARLKEALSEAKPEVANIARLQLFGEKGEAAAGTLLGKLDVVEQRMGILEGDAFERNVRFFEDSRVAERQQRNLRGEFAARDLDEERGRLTFQELRDELDTLVTEMSRDESRGSRAAIAGTAAQIRKAIGAVEATGGTPREALQRIEQLGGVKESAAGSFGEFFGRKALGLDLIESLGGPNLGDTLFGDEEATGQTLIDRLSDSLGAAGESGGQVAGGDGGPALPDRLARVRQGIGELGNLSTALPAGVDPSDGFSARERAEIADVFQTRLEVFRSESDRSQEEESRAEELLKLLREQAEATRETNRLLGDANRQRQQGRRASSTRGARQAHNE